MINLIKYDDLPEEMKLDLRRVYWTKINYIPLRSISKETGLSINTIKRLRDKKEASYKTWERLIRGLM